MEEGDGERAVAEGRLPRFFVFGSRQGLASDQRGCTKNNRGGAGGGVAGGGGE